MNKLIAIDPGVSGGIAFESDGQPADAVPMPTTEGDTLAEGHPSSGARHPDGLGHRQYARSARAIAFGCGQKGADVFDQPFRFRFGSAA